MALYFGRAEVVIAVLIVVAGLLGAFAASEFYTNAGLNDQISNLNNQINALNSSVMQLQAARIVTGGNQMSRSLCSGTCSYLWDYAVTVYYANVGRHNATSANVTATIWSSNDPTNATLCQATIPIGTISALTMNHSSFDCRTSSSTEGDTFSVQFAYKDAGP